MKGNRKITVTINVLLRAQITLCQIASPHVTEVSQRATQVDLLRFDH